VRRAVPDPNAAISAFLAQRRDLYRATKVVAPSLYDLLTTAP
jgi:hypothetical protein